ncbi:MAG: hypothetical protein ACFFDC_10355 [Promethearchaeota archaeon]
MLNRSILTAIIGFLVGCLLYYIADAGIVIVLVMGISGYFFGLFLDNADVKHQLDNFLSSSSEEIFQPTDLPESLILYSKKENLTTVSIDFQVETKPQTFRLSVLKNLQDHQFRILEDSNNTIFSLTLDFPECNYPNLVESPDLKEEFHYNIRERSLDFQNAVQKIVPGLVLSNCAYLDQFGDELLQEYSGMSSKPPQLPPSASNSIFDRQQDDSERGISHSDQDFGFEEGQVMNESHIMEDLLPGLSTELNLPGLSPNEAQQLKDSNQRQLEAFLNEDDHVDEVIKEKAANDELGSKKLESTNEIKIDFSKVDQPVNGLTKEDFEQDIISKLEERTKLALNKITPDLALQKERDNVRKYIGEEKSTEESFS